MTREQLPVTDRSALIRRPVFWLVVGAAVLVVALAVGAGWYLGVDEGSTSAAPSAAASAAATPRVTPTEAGTSPTPSTHPPAAVVVIPTDCTDIYTKDWTPAMGGLVLNPVWASDPAKSKQVATNDQGLATVLEANTDLYCKWGAPGGASDRGITTNLASLTSDQQAEMIAHAQDSGFSCYEELGGTRCVTETAPSDDGQAGESHFLRDGIWVATHWVNAQPDGYTHDIVAALFGS